MASIRDGDKACICYGAKQRMQKRGVLNGIECIVGPLSAGKTDCYDMTYSGAVNMRVHDWLVSCRQIIQGDFGPYTFSICKDFIILAPLQIGDTVRILDSQPLDTEVLGFIACIKYQDTVNESNSKYDVQFLGNTIKVRLIERRSMKFYGGGSNPDTPLVIVD